MVYRVYVEKKPELAGEATELAAQLREVVGIKNLEGVRILNRYDAEGLDENTFKSALNTVFSEPPADNCMFELPNHGDSVFAVEYLPGQYDQRADSAAQCIQIISQGERPEVRTAKVYIL